MLVNISGNVHGGHLMVSNAFNVFKGRKTKLALLCTKKQVLVCILVFINSCRLHHPEDSESSIQL